MRLGKYSTPSKDFEKFGYKNAIKHENRGPLPPPQIFSQPLIPPSKGFENDCVSMNKRKNCCSIFSLLILNFFKFVKRNILLVESI
jgi:hypothetical protein